ncbi:MAG: hypothetical protein AB8G15_09315 [Saprospiraceae bacterium]
MIALLFALNFATVAPVEAQCPMCRMSAESNLKDGGTVGRGLNKGILYMFATPYLLIGGFAYFWWRNRRKEEEKDSIELLSE